ncbi:hypothetical protein ACQP2F_33600 [Actinoplanes sp. CA-030573]|uniref:hypothetical protein n=1 Tax=Actinoplanes sp. CA-030573 TaxID=3239898 RepID=UPI003D8C8C60
MPERIQRHQQAAEEENDPTIYYTVSQVAKMIGVSSRWLADRCRAEEVDHVYMARKRKFTPEQVKQVMAQYTVKGPDREAEQRELERIARESEKTRARLENARKRDARAK